MRRISLLLLAVVFAFASCGDDEPTSPLAEAPAAITNYANMAFANYNAALTDAKALETAINAFVSSPSATTQQAAKNAWLAARESYGTTEAFRFAAGPIDEYGNAPEGALNAWPLDEVYIDYVSGDLDAGIVNDTSIEITKAKLISLNEEGGEANVSIGFHAIEFLLWGQDNSAPSAEQAGQRSFTDYTSADNADRRGDYLNAVASILVDDLTWVTGQWNTTDASNYRNAVLPTIAANDEIKTLIQSIAIFAKGELAGERMIVAYTNKDQEDEHSCFADNTHRDIILNAKGIANVYNGTYGAVSGTSLSDLVKAANADLNTEIETLLAEIATANDDIHVPFDNAISNESYRPNVIAAANKLKDLGDKLVEAATALGFTISAELPE